MTEVADFAVNPDLIWSDFLAKKYGNMDTAFHAWLHIMRECNTEVRDREQFDRLTRRLDEHFARDLDNT